MNVFFKKNYFFQILRSDNLKTRAALHGESREVTYIGPIHAIPHLTSRYYPPFCKFDWRFVMEKMAFFTMQKAGEAAPKFIITNAEIWLPRISVSPAVSIAHSNLLNSKNMLFPTKYMETRSIDVPAGSFNCKFPNIFSGGKMPQRLFAVMLDSEAKTGSLQKSPYVFYHCNIADIRCLSGSKVVPSISYKLLPEKFQTEALMANTLTTLKNAKGDVPTLLNRNTHTTGMFLMGFELTRDQNPAAEYQNSQLDSINIGLEINFHSALESNMTLMVIGEFLGTNI